MLLQQVCQLHLFYVYSTKQQNGLIRQQISNLTGYLRKSHFVQIYCKVRDLVAVLFFTGLTKNGTTFSTMVQYDNVKTLWKNFKTQLPGQGMTGPSKVIFHLHFSGCDIFYFVIILIEFCLNKVFGSNVYCLYVLFLGWFHFQWSYL